MKQDVRHVRLPEPQSMALQIAAGRALIATGIMAAPVLAARLLGADGATAHRVTWLTRMMAVRDGGLGVGGMAAARSGGSATIPWLLGGAVSDAVDALVIGGALKQGRVKGFLPAAIVPLAAVTAAAGVVTAVRISRRD
jgi:hypothetical protein